MFQSVKGKKPRGPNTRRNNSAPPDVNQSENTLAQNQNQDRNQDQDPNQNEANNDLIMIESFMSLDPPEFKGTTDPIKARAWLREMEKTFEIVGVEENKKTIFAAYLLKGEANFWWEAKMTTEGTGTITWTRFTELFLEKYVPKYLKNQLEVKFLELKQGNMSVVEYEAMFTELSRFVTYVDTDEKRANRFQQGLNPWIRSRVAVLEITSFSTLVRKAAIVESGSELYHKNKGGKKRKFDNRGDNYEGRMDGQNVKKPFVRREEKGVDNRRMESSNIRGGNSRFRPPQVAQSVPNWPPLPECKTCGRKHPGPCHQALVICFKCGHKGHYASGCKKNFVTCFNCGKKGHIARDCRQPLKENPVPRLAAPPGSKPTGSTFNMIVRDAMADNDVIAGTLLVNFEIACVLIDSRATRSLFLKVL